MATAETRARDTSRTQDAANGSVLSDLRELSLTSPALAVRQGWDYLQDLGKTGRRDQLAALFERGQTPEAPHGALEGLIVGNLFGIPEAYLANPLLKIDPTWRGKTFDTDTGFNRLAPLAKYAMRVIAPLYRGLRRAGSEMVGFEFTHRIDTAAIPPYIKVRALDYSPAEFRNPSIRTFPIKRTRDEIVELLPGLYLGRALLRMSSGEIGLIAYFALREFTDESASR
ncbi:hypothetical protein HGA11_30850 [Mycolicibacterium septicum DSM 44393]|uniref:Uncharacterized protein n=1 Tax=Mycolicibacterium septicum DSM 44393 TaxID=1341646 RepID=A0A7X6MW62_9MYCO|nr:hypothetical protein [Mycolicibacterium septicum]NKZ15379.1 hypothetical protein [Mycolicibacterium septicum DSM 44393]